MLNYLLPRLENFLTDLQKDFRLIAKKNKDDEWKRDHYRYTFTVSVQRVYDLLNAQLTEEKMLPISQSIRDELIVLRDKITEMLVKSENDIKSRVIEV